MNKAVFLVAITAITLSGCSRDYTPAAGETGEQTFKGACLECHEAVEGKENIYYELAADKQNTDFISKKVSSGSLLMPKFPNITADNLKAVSQYALEHSITKK